MEPAACPFAVSEANKNSEFLVILRARAPDLHGVVHFHHDEVQTQAVIHVRFAIGIGREVDPHKSMRSRRDGIVG